MLVCKDLPASQQVVQAVHAAHEAGIRFGDLSQISSVVVCSVPNEQALLCSKEELDVHGVKSYIFHEDDFGNRATALATEPIFGSKRKVLKKHPLWVLERQEV